MPALTPEQILLQQYRSVRARTEKLCAPLATEDHVPQPMAEVSPPKWHLGHSAWFFEHFVLMPHHDGFEPFDAGGSLQTLAQPAPETPGSSTLAVELPGLEEDGKRRPLADDLGE